MLDRVISGRRNLGELYLSSSSVSGCKLRGAFDAVVHGAHCQGFDIVGAVHGTWFLCAPNCGKKDTGDENEVVGKLDHSSMHVVGVVIDEDKLGYIE